MSVFLNRVGLLRPSAGGVSSLSFHDVAYSTTATISVPTLQAGDVMIISDLGLSKSGTPTLATPSGFTNWINIPAGFSRLAVAYKIATGSETTLTGMNADITNDKILAIFRPDIPVTMIAPSTPTTDLTDDNPSPQSIVATSGSLPLVAFGFYANGNAGAVSPRTMSPAATAELNGGVINYHYLKYQLQNATLADVGIDMDDEGNNNYLAGGYLGVS